MLTRLRSAISILVLMLTVMGCQSQPVESEPIALDLPTLAPLVGVPTETPTVPPTWTPQPLAQSASGGQTLFQTDQQVATRPPTRTPLPIPTNTPVTPTLTPSPTVEGIELTYEAETISKRAYFSYSLNEPLPLLAYPRPPDDNGWGMHWMPTVSQSPEAVDRFVPELERMHIKWVVILNDHTNVGDNDYLVDSLTQRGMMPVMRLYRDSILPYNGDIGALTRHYRARGVYYYQIYNEPNVNIENNQGAANPNHYAANWSVAARQVVNNGGLPGLAALSPGGEYNHLEFLRRTLRAIKFNGDEDLLNRTWISLHNYHGVRAKDDLGGFLMFREYDRIVQEELGRSLPIIGTEGGSYSPDPNVVIDLVAYQYTYMREAEDYYFATTYWLLANQAGGGWDDQWEWQALFQPGYTHPVVTEFFYQTPR